MPSVFTLMRMNMLLDTYVQAMGREGENMDVGEYLLIHNNPSTHQMVKIMPFDAYVSMSEVLSRWPL